jgi:hypothetical protein
MKHFIKHNTHHQQDSTDVSRGRDTWTSQQIKRRAVDGQGPQSKPQVICLLLFYSQL